jgi:DNA-binding NarL/FixJ family response regulator
MAKKSAPKSPSGNNGRTKWHLTRREVEVLGLLRTGVTDKEIAHTLGVSRSTASKHVEHLLAKMGVSNRTAAVSLSWQG